jgi:putative cardiolipin synthase
MTGTLLFEALHAAADRGVRVRFLLDDNTTQGLDPILVALDSHPSIEVRLFNPFVIRRPRIGYLTDFFRANRRMHNKSFTVDNQVTVIGGRNVGDSIGAAAEGSLFVDFDVAAVGPVVTEVSRIRSVFLLPPTRSISSILLNRRKSPTSLRQRFASRDPAALAYITAIATLLSFAQWWRQLRFEWAITHMIGDDPAKGRTCSIGELFHHQLRRIISGFRSGAGRLVSRSRRDWHRRVRLDGQAGRQNQDTDQLTGSFRCAGGLFGLCETTQASTRGRHHPLRNAAPIAGRRREQICRSVR